ncbi:MAG: HRDC domain-containing protein [Flavobacteriales bacterium]|nr:HRDC domain-containing protein [Flavobacteriales bacterium]MBP9081023.1 HRDC domain-containing protein [Flavobacteriales bacterium]
MPQAPLIAEAGDLQDLMARLVGETTIALDTEASSFHRFHERIGLIQLSNRQDTWLIDPLAVQNMDGLGQLLGSVQGETVVHDADFDLRLLKRMYGFRVRHIFDTLIAAELINEPELGLASLLRKYFGIQLDKRYQKADWTKRPLTEGMLEYAAMDTRHLIALRDLLAQQLHALGRMAWAEEEFALLTEVPFQTNDAHTPAFLRLKGAKALKPKELAVLRELHAWRDGVAARLDRASFMVLGNDVLIALSRQPVDTLTDLGNLKGVGQTAVSRYGPDILQALQQGLLAPKDQWPRVERPKRHPRDPLLEERMKRLKAVRDDLATRLELRPGVVFPNHLLTDIARAKPATATELLAVPGIRKYQVQEFGRELLDVV